MKIKFNLNYVKTPTLHRLHREDCGAGEEPDRVAEPFDYLAFKTIIDDIQFF